MQMKKWMTLIGAVIIATLAACTFEPKTSGIARVVTPTGTGSGFQIKSGEWLTAAHVVGNDQTVKLRLRDGREITAEVRWTDKFRDVAYLVAPRDMNVEVIPLVCVQPSIQTTFTHRGHPFGLPYGEYNGTVATDTIYADDRVPLWPEYFVADLTAAPGSSGGVIQRDGYAIGMVVGQFRSAPTMMIALSGKYLCDVIKWQEETIRLRGQNGS